MSNWINDDGHFLDNAYDIFRLRGIKVNWDKVVWEY